MAEPERETGLSTDPNLWGSLLFFLGSPAARLLTYVEHIEFLLEDST
jgi:hypothetical protein